MTGFVLLFAVACLGGVIATVGDRIGMKVGKSRLSLFNLRPRQTATLVSVVTGMVASFSTLLLLIALDDQLRKGLFQLDDIQQELSEARTDLEETQAEKDSVESTLQTATQQQEEAQARLRETNQSLRTAVAREEETLASLLETKAQLDTVSEQAGSLRNEISGLRSEREALIQEQATVRSQIAQRDEEIAQRNEEIAQRDRELSTRNQELQQRNQEIEAREQQIAQRDAAIAERESRLSELQAQQSFLTQEIAQLEEEFQTLRLGNVALARNQTLAFTVARANSEDAARRAVNDALFNANQVAAAAVLGIEDVDRSIIAFDPFAVERIVSDITDERNYVLRVSSGANYLTNEPCAQETISSNRDPCLFVNIEAAINEARFQTGDVLASVPVDAGNISNEALFESFDILRRSAEFEARRNGIIQSQPIIASGLSEPVFEFLARVQQFGQPVEIQAFASQPVFTTGPVTLELAAVQDSQVLFRTRGDGETGEE